MDSKIQLNNVTIISVACVRVDRALSAIKYSMKDIKFGACKLITNEDIKDDQVEIIKIDKLDYNDYNKFIVYELNKYVDTEFALLVQDDGFVLNANLWDNEFLKYDYIGAPWRLPMDDFSYRDSFKNIVRVGNGGFSLRSKKLMELPDILNLEWKSYFGFYNEDGFICCHNRHLYEENGCKFAPVDVASKFSFEYQIEGGLNDELTFGFHGKHNKYNSLI